LNDKRDPRIAAIPDVHGHAKGEHKPYAEERPIPLSARMLFLWFFHACRRGHPRFMMVSDHMNYLTFEDPAAVNLVRRALKLAQAGDLYGAAETANVDVAHARVVHDGLRRGMRYSIGAEVDNDPRCRPDAQNIVDSMKPDGMIRSVHFLPIDHPQHGAGWMWGFDNPEFIALWEHIGTEKAWELYMASVLDAIERLPGQILGHFYVAASFGHWPDDAKLEEYEDQVLDALLARGMAFELNSRFIYRHPEDDENRAKYIAVNTRMLRKAKAKGVFITASSDAHSPRDQGNAYDIVLQMLDDADVNELVFPIAGKFARVQLRVEKPAEPEIPEPAPLVEPPAATIPTVKADDFEAGDGPRPEEAAAETKPRAARAGSARTTASPAVRSGSRRTNARAAEAALDDDAPAPAPAAESEKPPSDERVAAKPKPKTKAKSAPLVVEAEPEPELPAVVEPVPEPVVIAEAVPEPEPEHVVAKKPSPAVKASAKPAAAKKTAPAKTAPARAAAPARPAPSAKAKAAAKPAPKAAAAAAKAKPKAVAAKPARSAAPVKKSSASSAKAKPVAKKAPPAKTPAKPAGKAKAKAKPAVKAPAKVAAVKTKPRSAKSAAKPVAKPTKAKAPVRASATKPAAKKTVAKKAPPKRR
jgi:Meckel syndrome type 1 protein